MEIQFGRVHFHCKQKQSPNPNPGSQFHMFFLHYSSKLTWSFQTMTNLHSILKSRDITLLTKVYTGKAMVFLVVMYGCESWSIKEGWVLENWCFWIVMLVKALESTLDYKEIKPINPKGNQPWIFIGRTDAEAPILWPSDVKSWLTGKDPDTEKDWRPKMKWVTGDEMVR